MERPVSLVSAMRWYSPSKRSEVEQVRQQQAGRTGADDAYLDPGHA
jgi:hypothetical protein